MGQVVDFGGKDTRERAYRNSAELSLHTDASDIVGMMCLVKAMEGGVVGSDIMKWLHGLATKTLGSATDFIADKSNGTSVLTPAEAAIRLSEIRNNPKHPYNNPSDPAHEAARKTVRGLYEMKDPKHAKDAAPGSIF